MPEPEPPAALLKTLLFLTAPWIALLILIAQNLMGMYLNLWLDFSRFSSVSRVFAGEPTLDAHVLVGGLILSLTFGRFVIGFRKEYRPFRTPSILLFLFALLAFGSGVEFTFFGNNDIFSFTMEVGFGGIIGSAAWVIYLADKLQRTRNNPTST